MIQSIIIDDEANNISSLQSLLASFCPQVEVMGTADNAKTGFDLIKSTNPQLVFLDIEMPYGNAFDLLNRIGQVNFEIIFVTAFDDYAIQAFKYSAIDYLLKPVNIEELKNAVERVSQHINNKSVNEKVVNLLRNMEVPNIASKKMALPTIEGLIFVKTSDVVRLEANKSYTIVHMADKQTITVTKALGSFEGMLQENIFCRIHHSHIINLDHIKMYHRGRGGYVEMEDGTSIEVSVRKKDFFLERFKI